jgi:hypothetical protein
LRAFRDGVDPPSEWNDTYSGAGTVMAVHELSNHFAAFGRAVRLKRAELLTWDEAQNTNLIVVGSPDANSRLRQLPPLQQFDFKSLRDEPRQGIGGIVNLHPRPGEEPSTRTALEVGWLPGRAGAALRLRALRKSAPKNSVEF